MRVDDVGFSNGRRPDEVARRRWGQQLICVEHELKKARSRLLTYFAWMKAFILSNDTKKEERRRISSSPLTNLSLP